MLMDDLIPPPGRRSAEVITAPDGSAVRLLLHDGHGATRCSMVEVTVPPGGVSRPVRHRTVEESWYVISGTGAVWRGPPGVPAADAAPAPVAPGVALVIPAGWGFQFRADDGAPLVFLCVTIPPWPGMDEAAPLDAGGLGPPTLPPP